MIDTKTQAKIDSIIEKVCNSLSMERDHVIGNNSISARTGRQVMLILIANKHPEIGYKDMATVFQRHESTIRVTLDTARRREAGDPRFQGLLKKVR